MVSASGAGAVLERFSEGPTRLSFKKTRENKKLEKIAIRGYRRFLS